MLCYQVITQPCPYGIIRKEYRRFLAFIMIITFIVCLSLIPTNSSDDDIDVDSRLLEADVRSDVAQVVVTATPNYTPPLK